jgi:hypothetical protein
MRHEECEIWLALVNHLRIPRFREHDTKLPNGHLLRDLVTAWIDLDLVGRKAGDLYAKF